MYPFLWVYSNVEQDAAVQYHDASISTYKEDGQRQFDISLKSFQRCEIDGVAANQLTSLDMTVINKIVLAKTYNISDSLRRGAGHSRR
jgi:hypothetical protein